MSEDRKRLIMRRRGALDHALKELVDKFKLEAEVAVMILMDTDAKLYYLQDIKPSPGR